MSVRTIKQAIKRFNKFLITSHINPEGDAIGSQAAMACLLRKLGKKFVMLDDSPVPKLLRFMRGTEDISKEMPHNFNYQAVIIMDSPDLARIGRVNDYIKKDSVIINIDHHISNVNFGKYNWVEPDYSSTGEMVYDLFKAFKVKIGMDEAVALYAAIMTDTGSFRYSNTSSKTHRITAELIDIGVKPYEMHSRIYETSSIQDTNLLGEALQTMKITDDGKIAWLWVTKEMLKKTNASLEGTEGIINFGRSIGGVEIAVLFRETGTKDRVKVSFRSKGAADVNKLAGYFGGGGHPAASGCSVLGKIEEVEKKVLEKAKEMLS
ncbi:MAG: bifunctional oligoribonuclease/PAP phosphatase NrnA [Candidatus Omnitrophica bacterium CG12_big_fil_rev_8_21_14_0_65_42_8]|nr:MAG: bifunctional oligoribonuclease/PAP phosphatase NrnA [Candidatus Omnitrophica bacterium CG12_big_fil_rev_8_21_14_0_65_42_8]